MRLRFRPGNPDPLPHPADRRGRVYPRQPAELQQAACSTAAGSDEARQLPANAIPLLVEELGVDAVFSNHDYEPAAIQRDQTVEPGAGGQQPQLTCKDQVIFEQDEMLTRPASRSRYSHPIRMPRLETADSVSRETLPGRSLRRCAVAVLRRHCWRWPSWVCRRYACWLENNAGYERRQSPVHRFCSRIDINYRQARDFPAVKGVSYLSVHPAFGTVSIRELARQCAAWDGSEPAAGPCTPVG